MANDDIQIQDYCGCIDRILEGLGIKFNRVSNAGFLFRKDYSANGIDILLMNNIMHIENLQNLNPKNAISWISPVGSANGK